MNATPSTPGAATSALPTAGPPVTRFSTPAGTPASCRISTSSTPDHGVVSAGLKTTVLPATRAAPIGPAASADGKLNGEMTPNTPYGRSTEVLRSSPVCDSWSVRNSWCSTSRSQ